MSEGGREGGSESARCCSLHEVARAAAIRLDDMDLCSGNHSRYRKSPESERAALTSSVPC